jgi:hypothetical protein
LASKRNPSPIPNSFGSVPQSTRTPTQIGFEPQSPTRGFVPHPQSIGSPILASFRKPPLLPVLFRKMRHLFASLP